MTHGVTIRRAARDVWPWLVQMGAGSRGGWYSYDWLDNGRQPSARRIVPTLQDPAIGAIFPAMPGMREGFTLLAIEPERTLTLGWLAPDGTPDVTWTFVLDEVAPGVTRLLVRVRGGPGYRFHGLPLLLTRLVVRIVHFIMQRKQLLGIVSRAEGCAAARPIDTVIAPHDRQDEHQNEGRRQYREGCDHSHTVRCLKGAHEQRAAISVAWTLGERSTERIVTRWRSSFRDVRIMLNEQRKHGMSAGNPAHRRS